MRSFLYLLWRMWIVFLKIDIGNLKVLVHPQQAIVIAKSVNHVLKTAAGGRFWIPCQSHKVFVDLFRVDLLWKLPEMKDKKGNAPDAVH